MPNAQPERQARVAILRWLRLVLPAGSIVAGLGNEEQPRSDDPHARARFVAAKIASGLVIGLPDLIAIIPRQVIFVEVKRPGSGGVVSERQAALHRDIRALGHVVIVATSIEEARHGLNIAGIALREAPGQLATPSRVRVARSRRLPDDDVPF